MSNAVRKLRAEVANEIKARRVAAGMRQLDLAHKIGRTQQHVSRIENPNSMQVSLDTLYDVTRALKCRLVFRIED